MPPKRKRGQQDEGMKAGELLDRKAFPGNISSAWGWVGSEVLDVQDITQEHILTAYGFSSRSNLPFCPNKYNKALSDIQKRYPSPIDSNANDVIVISDDEHESPVCSKKACKRNPNCLNYLSLGFWEDDSAFNSFFWGSTRLCPQRKGKGGLF